MDLQSLAIIGQIMFLDGVLSIDNAAVIATMASSLPDEPAPGILRKLGNQQRAALIAGMFGAITLRVVVLLLASILIQNSWLRLIGAAYLFYLVIKHFSSKTEGAQARTKKRGFWRTVIDIEQADFWFSFDNLVAIIALTSNVWLLVVGIVFSIVMMRVGAQVFQWLLKQEKSLEHGAYLIIGAIALQLTLREVFKVEIPELVQPIVSISILVLTGMVARFLRSDKGVRALERLLLLKGHPALARLVEVARKSRMEQGINFISDVISGLIQMTKNLFVSILNLIR